MFSTKRLNDRLDVTSKTISLQREELTYSKMLNSMLHDTRVPSELRDTCLAFIQENIPFSEKQVKVKSACDAWLDGFRVDSSVDVIELVYQIGSLLNKVPFNGDDSKRFEAALSTFREGEAQCKETNSRLSRYCDDFAQLINDDPWAARIVSEARHEISRIIGDLTDERKESIVKKACVYGPGQTNGMDWGVVKGSLSKDDYYQAQKLARAKCSTPHKLSGDIMVTPGCLKYVAPMLASNFSFLKAQYARLIKSDQPVWDIVALNMQLLWNPDDAVKQIMNNVCICAFNEVSFVPKNSKTLRTIAKENPENGKMQKSVGSDFKRCLHRHGINLYDQSINQRLALRGSIDGCVSTQDVKNASGTVAVMVVKLLLDWGWYEFLSELRSESGLLALPDGSQEMVSYEQFSSMGNGYTFELESLIFTALTRAVVKLGSGKLDLVSVYGDDIIVPTEDVAAFERIMAFSGFTINRDKSFSDGPFRESCGMDAYNGRNIKPVVLKRRLLRVVDVWFYMNRLAYTCLTRKDLSLAAPYAVLNKVLKRSERIPGPLTFSFVEDPAVEGRFELCPDDMESGLKMPLSCALEHNDVVRMQRNGLIKYYRLKVQPSTDDEFGTNFVLDEKYRLPLLDDSNNPSFEALQLSKVDFAGVDVFKHIAFLYGFRGGRVPLRGFELRKFRKTTSLGWETYPASVIRHYFPYY